MYSWQVAVIKSMQELVWQVVLLSRNVKAHLEISTMKSEGGTGLSTVFGV